MTRVGGGALLDALVQKQAALLAFLADFKRMLFVTIAALPLVFVMRRPAPHTTDDDEVTAALE